VGRHAAGFRGQAAVGKFLTKDVKIETEGVWSSTRFAPGKQDVRIKVENVRFEFKVGKLW